MKNINDQFEDLDFSDAAFDPIDTRKLNIAILISALVVGAIIGGLFCLLLL